MLALPPSFGLARDPAPRWPDGRWSVLGSRFLVVCVRVRLAAFGGLVSGRGPVRIERRLQGKRYKEGIGYIAHLVSSVPPPPTDTYLGFAQG